MIAKTVLLSAMVVGAFADISKFPSFDSFHANCAIEVTYSGKSCATVWASMKDLLTQYEGGDPGKGIYAFVDTLENKYFWLTRTTPVKKYVDDIAFEFLPTASGDCIVKSRSRSQSLSYYDYSTNYCNIWNPLKYTANFTNEKVTQCPFPASDPATTCNIY